MWTVMLKQSCGGSLGQQQPGQSPFYWASLLFLALSSKEKKEVKLLKQTKHFKNNLWTHNFRTHFYYKRHVQDFKQCNTEKQEDDTRRLISVPLYWLWCSILPVWATVEGWSDTPAPLPSDTQMLPAADRYEATECHSYTAVHSAYWLTEHTWGCRWTF